MKSISGMLNFAGQAISVKKAAETLQSDISQRKAESERAGIETNVSRETAQPRIQTAQQTAQQQEVATNLSKFRLTGEYAQKARDIGNQLVSDPDVVNGNVAGILPKLLQARQMMVESGVPADVAEVNVAHLIGAAAANPKGFRQVLLNSIQAGVGAGGQATNIRPNGIGVTNQQQTAAIETNPFSSNPVGTAIPGTTQQQQLPPSATTVNAQGQSEYLGPQATPPARVVAGNPPGFGESAAGSADVVNKDWASTTASADKASTDIGVLQNIKKYASGAFTGVESDRRSYLAGLSGLLGMSEEQMAKTDTDLLAKNSTMLALAGGNTDLARTLAESANPNNKMTPEAIKSAADQVIAQRKLAIAKQKLLQPIKALNDPAMYSKALASFNEIADPRVLQVKDMSSDELGRMKAAMSPSEQAEFRKKIMRMKELGIINE
jgi:hypothetical protein